MIEYLQNLFSNWGMGQTVSLYIGWAVVVIGIILGAIIANYITKKILLNIITRIIRKTKFSWDDYLLENKVFTRLSHIAPALVIYFTSTGFPQVWQNYLQRFSTVYMIVAGLFVVSAFLNAVIDAYRTLETARKRPIKGYIQVAKIIIFIFVGIYAVGVLLDQSVMPILDGLGAMTAVILLVFKDSILGLVASIQLSSYDMVRLGDWIEMPKYGIDGDVIDISLNTVKVQNFDKNIITIPAYTLVSDSFKNWRGMAESGGRRIKRAIYIDMNSIKFATEEMLNRWEKFDILISYLKAKREELAKYNEDNAIDISESING